MGKIPDHRRGLGAFFVPSSILASELHGDRGGEVGIVKVFFWGVLFFGGGSKESRRTALFGSSSGRPSAESWGCEPTQRLERPAAPVTHCALAHNLCWLVLA